MGRTRRMGPPPPMTTARIPYDVVERLNRLKKHKDEPIWKLLEESCLLLEERRDPDYYNEYEERGKNIGKLQRIITTTNTDLDTVLTELKTLGITLECFSQLSEKSQRYFMVEKEQQ